MSILSVSQMRTRNLTEVTVVSSLSGVVYYHWYMDGAYLGYTNTPSRAFMLGSLDQSRIDILDTDDPDFDAVANAPSGFPARRTLVFVRSMDVRISSYRVEQRRATDAWIEIALINDDPARWTYEFLSPRLDDLTSYAWRVIPIDDAGNDGTAVSLGGELIVRTPDSPDFSAALQVSTHVLFAAA